MSETRKPIQTQWATAKAAPMLDVIQKMNEEEYPFFSVGYPDQERLEVALLSPPADKDVEGYDWITAKATIRAGGFFGRVDLMISKGDMVSFMDQLKPVYENLKGHAEFSTLEDQLRILVKVNDMGHVKVSGYLKDDPSLPNTLNFHFEYDQTLLWHTISEIDEALFEMEGTKG